MCLDWLDVVVHMEHRLSALLPRGGPPVHFVLALLELVHSGFFAFIWAETGLPDFPSEGLASGVS